MNSNPTGQGNSSNALDPIQLATVEEIIEHYPDHPQASFLLCKYLSDASANCDDEASKTAVQIQALDALDALSAYYRDHPHPLPMLHDRVQNDWRQEIKQAAVESIAKHYQDDPQTYSWLWEQAQHADNIHVRFSAVAALGDYFSHEPQTLEFLRDRYQSDDNHEIRQIALRQIAQHFSNDPQTATLLHDCLNNVSELKNLRNEALWQIAKQYCDDPQTLPLLHNCLQSEQNTFAVTVLGALAEYYKDDPQTLPTLHEYARQGREDAVRLLLNYPSHPEMFEILRDRAQALIDRSAYDYDAFRGFVKAYPDHPQTRSMVLEVIQTRLNRNRDNLDKSVAQFALGLLMEYYPEHPETLPFLISSVERSNDKFSETERWMINLLVRHYPDDPSILPFLKQIAQNHASEGLRTAALCNMAWGYGSNPETLPFLQQCIQVEQNRDRSIWIWDVMNTIGNACADNPQTLSWLKQLAHDTDNDKLRKSAIKVLSNHFLSDPETYQLLSDVAQHESDEKIRLTAFRAIAKHTAKTEGDQSDEWEPISIEVPDIPHDCSDDYIPLRDLLKGQQWQAADTETYYLIQQIQQKLGRESGSVIRLEEILSMSSEDLQTIDRLWISTSWGHFGFSIQREIYLQCGGTLDGRYPGDQVWQRFCQRVGWIVSGFFGSYRDIQFHLRAPAGHLPLWATVSDFGDCRYQHLFTDQTPEIDYTKLRNLLENNQWKDADYETYLIMLQAVSRCGPGEGVSKEELRQFPCTVLQTIDQLWTTASKGKFGFSLQKNIYLESGGVLNGQIPSVDVWEEFNRRVGWYGEGRGICYDDLTFSLDAPIGHLPTPCWYTYKIASLSNIGIAASGLYDCIFPRIEACT